MVTTKLGRLQIVFLIMVGLPLLPLFLIGPKIDGYFRLQILRRKLKGPKRRQTLEALRQYSDRDMEIAQEMSRSYKNYLKPVADFYTYAHLGSTFTTPNQLEKLTLLPKASELSSMGRAYLRRLKQVYEVLVEFDEDSALWISHLDVIEQKLES